MMDKIHVSSSSELNPELEMTIIELNPKAKAFIPQYLRQDATTLASAILRGKDPKSLGIDIDKPNTILRDLASKSLKDITCLHALYYLYSNSSSEAPFCIRIAFTTGIAKIRKKILTPELHSCTVEELFILGSVSDYGIICKQDNNVAILAYQAASLMTISNDYIKREISEAVFKLGCMCLGFQLYEQKKDNIEQAVVCLKAAEKLGHPEAITKLNVLKDKSYKLGCRYQRGEKDTLLKDKTRNFADAERFYIIAKDLQHPDAQAKLDEVEELIQKAFTHAKPKKKA